MPFLRTKELMRHTIETARRLRYEEGKSVLPPGYTADSMTLTADSTLVTADSGPAINIVYLLGPDGEYLLGPDGDFLIAP